MKSIYHRSICGFKTINLHATQVQSPPKSFVSASIDRKAGPNRHLKRRRVQARGGGERDQAASESRLEVMMTMDHLPPARLQLPCPDPTPARRRPLHIRHGTLKCALIGQRPLVGRGWGLLGVDAGDRTAITPQRTSEASNASRVHTTRAPQLTSPHPSHPTHTPNTHNTGRRDARGREEADTRARRHQQPSSLGQERPGTKRATSEPACVPLSLPFQQQQQQHRAQQQQQSVVIMSALVSAFGQAARAAAKALENAGRMLEAAPYVEHRK